MGPGCGFETGVLVSALGLAAVLGYLIRAVQKDPRR